MKTDLAEESLQIRAVTMTLSPGCPDACWPASKKGDTGAKHMGEHNHQDPDEFVLSRVGFVGCAVNDHPDPKDGPENPHQSEHTGDEEKKDAHSHEYNISFPCDTVSLPGATRDTLVFQMILLL